MDPLFIAMITQLIKEKETSREDKSPKQEKVRNIHSYFPREKFSDIKNPKLKMGHPIIQPRGQNH
jgi:hypothetical protein